MGRLAILFACFLWGTTGVASSFVPDVSPLAIGAFGMGVGGVLLMITSLKPLYKDYSRLVQCRTLLLVGALAVVVYPLAFYSSMRLAGVAVGNLVSLASAPFFTIILECLIGKKKPSLLLLSTLAIGIAGIALLAQSKEETQSDVASLQHLWGIGLGLLAGLSYGLYSWVAKGMIDQGISSKSAMASMFGLASAVLLPSLWITGDHLLDTPFHQSVALYIALVPMFIGYLSFGYGLRYVTASSATLMTLFEPVIATILAVMVVGEVVSTQGWFGIALIMVCLLLQVTAKQKS